MSERRGYRLDRRIDLRPPASELGKDLLDRRCGQGVIRKALGHLQAGQLKSLTQRKAQRPAECGDGGMSRLDRYLHAMALAVSIDELANTPLADPRPLRHLPLAQPRFPNAVGEVRAEAPTIGCGHGASLHCEVVRSLVQSFRGRIRLNC